MLLIAYVHLAWVTGLTRIGSDRIHILRKCYKDACASLGYFILKHLGIFMFLSKVEKCLVEKSSLGVKRSD